MNKNLQIALVVAVLLIGGAYYVVTKPEGKPVFMPDQALAAKFD